MKPNSTTRNTNTTDKTDNAEEIHAENQGASDSGDSNTVLKQIPEVQFHGEVIGKIRSGFCYVHKNALISDVADALHQVPDLPALGIISEDSGKTCGILKRSHLFNALGRQFGRDLNKNKTIERLCEEAPVFDWQTNIFAIADELDSELHDTKTLYFLLCKGAEQFAGIFSTKDLLIYLSNITRQDINLARSLQSRMIKYEKTIPGKTFSALFSSRMAKGVGGDYYFSKQYSEENWIFSVCDVSGKGAAASLVTAVLDGMFTLFDFSQGLKNFLTTLNSYILDHFELEKYLTTIILGYDEENLRLQIFDCGHSHIFLFRDERFFRLQTGEGNPPIGIMPELPLNSSYLQLKENDLLLVITDGYNEQVNPEGEEFGMQRIAKILGESPSGNLTGMRDRLINNIDTFRDTQPQHDDMTLLLLHVSQNEPARSDASLS